MNRQGKTSEKQLNEVDLDNLPERESRVIRVKMTQDLRIKMEMIQELFTKGLEEQKSKQIEINNTLERINMVEISAAN